MEAVHIAVVVGGGLIGKRHLEEIDRSADAVEALILRGLEAAQNTFNS